MGKREEDRLVMNADREAAGKTVDWYLCHCMGFTKAQIRSVKFWPEGIRVNGTRSRVTRLLEEGDRVEVLLKNPVQTETGAEAVRFPSHQEERHLEVLYEDEDVLAVWKPAGMVLHQGHGHYGDTLSDRVQKYLAGSSLRRMYPDFAKGQAVVGREEELYHASAEPPRSIGRLDRDTSGVMVFGKNRAAASRLWEQRGAGSFRKEYLAWCEGCFPEEAGRSWQTICAPIGRQEGALNKMCVTADGRYAVTHYQVAAQYTDSALLRLVLETGRTHQIRVHLSYYGHPLVRDPIYGKGTPSEGNAASSMFLCAWQAEFMQPFTNVPVSIHLCSELPDPFADGGNGG